MRDCEHGQLKRSCNICEYEKRIEVLGEAVKEAHRIILHEMDNGRTPTMLKAEHGGKGLGYFEDLINIAT